ncbi:hypothetical protein B0H14DRAFT_3486696 [Mycena olivaceomarginata]|nr:hypothetical protein B0H14DRAFT_3486696 [Mycena olivaceomarginata]
MDLATSVAPAARSGGDEGLGIDPAAPPALFRLPPSLLGSAPGATFAGLGHSPLLPASPVFRTLRAVLSASALPLPLFFRLPPPPLGSAPGATLAGHIDSTPSIASSASRAPSAVSRSRHRTRCPPHFFGSRRRCSALRPAPPSRGTGTALFPSPRQLPALSALNIALGIDPPLPTYNDVLFASTPAACLPAPHRLHARHCTGSRPRCLCARPAFTPLAVTL